MTEQTNMPLFASSQKKLSNNSWDILTRKPKKETPKEKGNRIAKEIFEQW
jgi:hypothetical protein